MKTSTLAIHQGPLRLQKPKGKLTAFWTSKNSSTVLSTRSPEEEGGEVEYEGLGPCLSSR